MASSTGRTLLRSSRSARIIVPRYTRSASTVNASMTTNKEEAGPSDRMFKKEASRNPELYILATVMTGAFALAGYYFARKPTSSSSEQTVSMVQNSEPWQTGRSGKYQYHPGGDRTRAPKDAPSALHSVVVPNVNLPAELHERFNKYEKEEFDDY